MADSPSVVVVDDDDQVRESLATLIQSLHLNVECYASGPDLLERCQFDRPGCIVLDLKMPQLSGLEVIHQLRARGVNTPIVMISGHGDIPAAVSAMKAGAVDFFEKPYRGAALLDAVRRCLELDAGQRRAVAERRSLNERFDSLTADEIQVLELTAAGKPDKAIALKLDLSLRTIQLRRASLMRKLGCHNRAELIRLAQAREEALAPQNTG